MTVPKYSASFTAGSLFVNEFSALGHWLIDEHRFVLLNNEIKQNNLLSIKSETARKRVVSEIKKRIQAVDDTFWPFFLNCTEPEKRLALFYLCLKTYPLVFDLHFEVVVKRWRILEREISAYEVQMRMDELASYNDSINEWSSETRQKLITVFLRMLREAKLLNQNTLMKPTVTNADFWYYFIQQGDEWFLDACFLPKHEKEALL